MAKTKIDTPHGRKILNYAKTDGRPYYWHNGEMIDASSAIEAYQAKKSKYRRADEPRNHWGWFAVGGVLGVIGAGIKVLFDLGESTKHSE